MEILKAEKLLLTIGMFLGYYLLRLYTMRGIEKVAKKRLYISSRTMRTKKIFAVTLTFILLICLLLVWGINVEEIGVGIATLFTVAGVACFASWSNLSNISSGAILFFNYNLKIGDHVRVIFNGKEVYGTIIDTGLFCLRIDLDDNEGALLYPNNLILHQPLIKTKKNSKAKKPD